MNRITLLVSIAIVAIQASADAQQPKPRPPALPAMPPARDAKPAQPPVPAPAQLVTTPAAPVQAAPTQAAPAQGTPAPVARPDNPAQPAPSNTSDDAEAIKSLLDTFTKAFDEGNAEAVAATYTETALVIDELGEKVEGREAIAAQYADFFTEEPGRKISIEIDALKFLSPDSAIEQGRTTITPNAGAPEITKFTTVYVKQDGKWLQALVRDEPALDLSPHEHLKKLEWLIGDWVNESQDATVTTSCDWAKGGNFIDREFSMKIAGQHALSGTQRIGWDPLKQQFKTWIFDSEGGHGEGHFTHLGNQWLVKVEGTRPDGKAVSATNVITRIGNDRLSWESSARTLGGVAVPGIDEFVLVRKPPAPRGK